jgi:cellulose synthase/poly-beta-1,6-N-acetylglucosamine synthase-like glycosyltransferase
MFVFYFLAAIVIWLGVLSLRNGFAFERYVRSESTKPLANYSPFVTVILPYRGVDQGLEENIRAVLAQDYPLYELLFVTAEETDPATALIRKEIERSNRPSRLLVAGAAIDSGQKVHNLRFAVSHVADQTAVLVFMDSDARPQRDWLKTLVAPLEDQKLGAATGYRWFVPVCGGFSSHLRAVWNASIASALGAKGEKNFCWGGSTAIRRDLFEKLKVRDRWRGSVSDDFTMTRTLHEQGWPVHFVPACLVPSFEDCGFAEMLEFTTRQLKITRVYAFDLWKALLLGSLIFNGVFWGGLALLMREFAQRRTPILLSSVLLIIFALGFLKSWIRFRAVATVVPDVAKNRAALMSQLFLWPLASLLYLVNAFAALSSRIHWRGITYELKSPTQAVIIRRNP